MENVVTDRVLRISCIKITYVSETLVALLLNEAWLSSVTLLQAARLLSCVLWFHNIMSTDSMRTLSQVGGFPRAL